MPGIAVPVRCPKCDRVQVYRPRDGTMPKYPRKRCERCGCSIYVKRYRLNKVESNVEENAQRGKRRVVRRSSEKKKEEEEKNEDKPEPDVLEELEGLEDLELLKFHYRNKLLKKNPELRALDSFRQFLKELDEFKRAKELQQREIEEELQTKGVNELVELALKERRHASSQSGDSRESLSHSGSS